jgi:hypothetical protein
MEVYAERGGKTTPHDLYSSNVRLVTSAVVKTEESRNAYRVLKGDILENHNNETAG